MPARNALFLSGFVAGDRNHPPPNLFLSHVRPAPPPSRASLPLSFHFPLFLFRSSRDFAFSRRNSLVISRKYQSFVTIFRRGFELVRAPRETPVSILQTRDDNCNSIPRDKLGDDEISRESGLRNQSVSPCLPLSRSR